MKIANFILHYQHGNPVVVEFSIDLINIPDDPVLDSSTNCRIKEHALVGTEVCRIGIIEEGDSPIISIDFVDYQGNKVDTPFKVDTNGTVTVANSDTLDYESQKFYNLSAIATNESGLKSRPYDYNYYDDYEERGRVYITLINDPDDAPILERKTLYVDENISIGEKIGNILKNKGKADITNATIYRTSYRNYGNPPSIEPSKLFDIDLNGNISVKAPLDYEKNFKPCQNDSRSKRYCEYVNIVMTNRYGSTTLYQQEIEIGDVPDAPPTLKPNQHFSVDENSPNGTVIGKIDLLSQGDANVTDFTLLGDGAGNFSVDNQGVIEVANASALDYERIHYFALQAIANNRFGDSSPVNVTINLNDMSEAIAQLGNLADAEVKIYKIEDNGTKTLLYTAVTSSGDTLDDDTFYLYYIKGGKDFDSNDDGVKDANFTTNKGVIRAIAKGSDIKQAGDDFRVTAVSELLYERVHRYLVANFDKDSFENHLEQEAKNVLTDATIDDILTFDPVNDRVNLSKIYKNKYTKTIDLIHQGKIPLLNFSDPTNPTKLGSYNTAGYAWGVTLSSDGSKAYVADGGKGLVVIDVSDPTNPTKLGSYDTAGYAEGVTLSSDGSKAYVADDNNGLVVIDIGLLNE